jgi:hypothetical protein
MKKRQKPKTFSDILTMEYRWPKKGDRLLRQSGNWNEAVSFAEQQTTKHALLWDGYMTAGAALIDACVDDPHERNALIYPILFNYRHGVEIAMKWIITMYGGRSADKIEHHDLWKLWKLCRPIAEEGASEDDCKTLDVVEKIIKELHDLDKDALAFRYWRTKDGTLIKLPDGLIDLENLRDVMEGVAGFFQGLDGRLDAMFSAAPSDGP